MYELNFHTLREKNVQRSETAWDHALTKWSVAEWANATAGELGEAVGAYLMLMTVRHMGEASNLAKKMLRWDMDIRTDLAAQSRDKYKNELARELADTIVYIDLLAASEGIDLQEAIIKTFNKKSDEIGTKIKL